MWCLIFLISALLILAMHGIYSLYIQMSDIEANEEVCCFVCVISGINFIFSIVCAVVPTILNYLKS